mmetsp:Transcript_10422/g.14724  ORF Transcript_10422/g.14724 Transcript_10422/m.14724 type:complete len:711 (-) Transcript_10422:216-2348(-)
MSGTILEAAFVDPAYLGSPSANKNGIELQVFESQVERANDIQEEVVETTTVTTKRGWGCCRSSKDVEVIEQRDMKKFETKMSGSALEPKGVDRERYANVPEGILIYRLDTASRELKLMSKASDQSDGGKYLVQMKVAKSGPSDDKSRRGMSLVGVDGTSATLVACEQRTAIAWLEAMDMMLGHSSKSTAHPRQKWASEKLNTQERNKIEEDYLTLANYSNQLIRAGTIPGQEQKKAVEGAGGIYYSVEVQPEEGEKRSEEALESIAKRRAVIKDSWDFYRMICSLLRDRRKYDEVFRKLQLDPVYPYLNSMTGLNDPGDDGYENNDKAVIQKDVRNSSNMTKTQIAQALMEQAEESLPALVEICKALAGSLGMEEVGIGPIKEAQAAIRKAEKKYNGDLLKVTDYCRALLVVKDFPCLLALLELARDSFGPLIRRVKLSTMKRNHKTLPGGYRDCKINLELKGHICEIQVHIWPMWVVCGVDGFRHYRHCLEYSTDSFDDPYDALDGLDRKVVAELIVMSEEAVADTPLDELEWYQEKYILDYFAEAGLFMKHGLYAWAETTLNRLITLRTESPDIGRDHHETMILYKYLEQTLRARGKEKEANKAAARIEAAETKKSDEKEEAEKGLWESLVSGEALDMIMDPNRKEREEEEKIRKEVKASKKQWRKIRQQRYHFLDGNGTEWKQSNADVSQNGDGGTSQAASQGVEDQ